MLSKEPVLVAFLVEWSQPCRVFDSILQEVAHALAGKVKIVKVNADDCLDLSLVYDIQAIPNLLCFLEGRPRHRIVGTATTEAILNQLKTLGIIGKTDAASLGLKSQDNDRTDLGSGVN